MNETPESKCCKAPVTGNDNCRDGSFWCSKCKLSCETESKPWDWEEAFADEFCEIDLGPDADGYDAAPPIWRPWFEELGPGDQIQEIQAFIQKVSQHEREDGRSSGYSQGWCDRADLALSQVEQAESAILNKAIEKLEDLLFWKTTEEGGLDIPGSHVQSCEKLIAALKSLRNV